VANPHWPDVTAHDDGTLTLTAGEGVTASVVRALAAGEEPPPPFTVRTLTPLPAVPEGERPITADQTHRSVIVGETVVVKWFPRPVRGPHPAPALLARLAGGFTRTATPYACVFWEDALVALVVAYLPEARDGWEWCVDEAVAGRTGFADEIGRLAAELHLVMATPSDDPVRLSPPAVTWRARAEQALREALALTDGDDGEWLAARADALRRELEPLASAGPTPLIRIHGDLHVGQILRWRDGYAVVDFDGNPTISDGEAFQPAARDLAQLRTSVDHAAQVAIKRRNADPAAAVAWAAEARDILRRSYKAALTEAGHPDLLDESLLRPFEVEQECRELIYAGRHLARWRYAPMGVLRLWFP
jgi:maltokinase